MHSLSIGDRGHLWAPFCHHPGWWIGGLLRPLALITGWLVVWRALYPGLPFRPLPLRETAPSPSGWAVVIYAVTPYVLGGLGIGAAWLGHWTGPGHPALLGGFALITFTYVLGDFWGALG